jgi:hypothetical protein
MMGFHIDLFTDSALERDRQDFEFVKTSLAAKGFDVVYDINGDIS